MFSRDHLAALAAIVRTGSFEAAAAFLNVTPSAVSQRIRLLEEQVGTTLLVRSQPVRPTPPGERLARHAEAVEMLESATLAELGLDPATATLRIAVNADSLATWVLPAIASVPDVLFDIVVDDQDHSADLLRRGEVVAAITAAGSAVQGCDVFPLGSLRYIATASPAYLGRWCPSGVTPASLARAPALTFNLKDRLQKDWFAGWSGRSATFPTHVLPTSEGFVTAAILGLGWGMNPEPLVRDHLLSGRLVDLAPGTGLDVPLAWQVSRLAAPALAPITRSIRAAASAVLI